MSEHKYTAITESGRRARVVSNMPVDQGELLRQLRGIEAQRFGRERRASRLSAALHLAAWFALCLALWWLATR